MDKLVTLLDALFKWSHLPPIKSKDDNRPPPNPENFTATVFSSTEIKLDWTSVVGATKYRLERRRVGELYGLVAKLGPSETDYLDSGLTANTQYSYRIRAFREHMALADSEISARTLEAD